MTWLLFVILILGTFRVTRFVVEDDFPPVLALRRRVALARRMKDVQPLRGETFCDFWWLGQLVTCGWCASGWLSLGMIGLAWIWISIPLPVFTWLAVWGGASALMKQFG